MLTPEQIQTYRQTLKPLLNDLRNGDIECIEYGKPDDRFYSYLRIRFIATAGGPQFQIRILTHGIEGSGYYTPDTEDVVNEAMKTICHYHRPMQLNFSEELKKRICKSKEGFTFFPVTNESTRTMNLRQGNLEDWKPLKDAIVMDLTPDPE